MSTGFNKYNAGVTIEQHPGQCVHCGLYAGVEISGSVGPPVNTMQTTWPAIFSAIAALCSAVCASIMIWVQRTNFLETIRPQIILTDWERMQIQRGASTIDVLRIGTISNIGKGPALHLVANCNETVELFPLAVMGTIDIPVLPANNHERIDADIYIHLGNTKTKQVGAKVVIWCWDNAGMRHETTYSISISPADIMCFPKLADGVILMEHKVERKAGWHLKILTKSSRLATFLTKVGAKVKDLLIEVDKPALSVTPAEMELGSPRQNDTGTNGNL